ncbi:UDP-N-acetylglucosamine 1-carboxyvinyltransferase [uncultured Ruminococcus sp.]|uniref:UDP-N-acetylglucosamine 1-carboxyvinyltransferase n=1 Tax=uncultured Ruminococcus sp. TaxID=165186 RepID=UPI0025EA5218|nr:UDP-N-acetylglucosamine 1-carboxyvinyltransferase [uncultured Ruminococcus sp.]
MEKFVINGGIPLRGTVNISGAKNAAVALVAATILCDEPCILENVPEISDITKCLKILRDMGADIQLKDRNTVYFDTRSITEPKVPEELARTMRASSYFLGTLLGRFHEAYVPMPGGCNLGDRPIDQHLKAFNALGAKDEIINGSNHVWADSLIGNQIYFDFVTVGATMNAIFAAVKAKGMTVIENAAKEPHIVDLANFLNSMGADIRGAGTDVIKIRGVEYLKGVTYATIPDQIEAGTYMVAAAATKGDVTIANVIPKHLESITVKLRKCGVHVEENDESVHVWVDGPLMKTSLKTMPHPGFPTDMQPQFSTLLTMAEGTSIVTDDIFDNRFRYVAELRRMGADISVDGKVAVIQGVGQLKGAPVSATDLRAGAAMVIAGLAAQGTTEIDNIFYIERGYENIDEKLRGLGADIKRVIKPDVEAVKLSG